MAESSKGAKKAAIFNLVVGLRSGRVLAWQHEKVNFCRFVRSHAERAFEGEKVPPTLDDPRVIALIPEHRLDFIHRRMYAVPGGILDHLLPRADS